ncbi:MAG: hypothetical protein UY71_C0006G0002 [Parcubacteria group bacterium GW2011_GWB1_52_7]|nr:MAG: hypothetical protein UY64_C0013G0009 [Parcubacteria group bacterium GW2011_GWA1_51_12]KKW28967.1 MAG: hypothetical protein UY71_C0006G0002 [Parcubacteria group bacterium GW2011_GWB1_52_7]KKW31750.1 MAG: hypothetical protein UY75_C0001G0005 [Parcubacteria group bacterium GW2011_GWC2_52_8c]
MAKRFSILTKNELSALAKKLAAKVLKLSKGNNARLISLSGELGGGKTTFTQFFAKALGVRGRVLSPTFVVAHEHPIAKKSPYRRLIHIDAYRIDGKKFFDSTEIRRYLKNPENIVVIEWGERISKWIPKSDVTMHLQHYKSRYRKVCVISKFKNQNGK